LRSTLAAQVPATTDESLARKLAAWREQKAREAEEASAKMAREG
jgi:hypothetical protein